MDPGIQQCNSLSEEAFIETFANVVEHTRQVAVGLNTLRPFTSVKQLLACLDSVIYQLPLREKEIVLEGHPDLAGRLADANLLTAESTREQKEAGLDKLSTEEKCRLKDHNDQYRAKFGFTFIVCARQNKAQAILDSLDKRLHNTRAEEVAIGIGEVGKIARLRSEDIISSMGAM